MENILVKDSGIHGTGVFADRDIKKDERIIQYIGEMVSKEEGTRREISSKSENDGNNGPRTYIFELNDSYDIDGDVPDNHAKYINHSCEPNCRIDIINDEIWIFADRDIRKGEELTYNYGFDLDDKFMDEPCRCGSPSCVGYIMNEDDMPRLREIIKVHKILK